MHYKDWLSRNHEELYDQAAQSMTYLMQANIARMGLTGFQTWITNTLLPAYATFKAAFETWKNPSTRTLVMTAALRTAEEAFIPLYRKLYTGILKNNPLVTNTDLVAMGISARSSGERHPAGIPKTAPKLSVKTPNPGIVEIDFGAKPADAHGLEVCWAVLEHPPTNWSELVHSSFDTASPFNLSFEGNQRGGRLYFAGRWENSRGEKGPWSEIHDTIIP